MALTLPSTLKLITLKALAFKCGISTSGTKPILTRRLIDEITSVSSNHVSQTKTKTKSPLRILSIDMGIRNLAYCILDIPNLNPTTEPPTLISWQRLSVSTAPRKPEGDDTPIPKETFDPRTFSIVAYNLLRSKLLLENPTHILIERQRFRSMGSKHILEWTIRVNMFESMIYAILTTLSGEGIWKGTVRAIAPGKVGPFWVGEDEKEKGKMEKERRSKSMKVIHKGLKMDLVRTWLQAGEMVRLGNGEVEEMARRYKEKWDRVPGGRKKGKEGEGEEKMGKLDDLADSLLQGLAWVEWERNKRIVLRKGYEALLEP